MGFIDCSLLLAVVAHLKFGHMAQICPDLLIVVGFSVGIPGHELLNSVLQ
jgi:hypothetical protein